MKIWQNRFIFTCTRENGYSVCWDSICLFGKTYMVQGGWEIAITTPPPKDFIRDPDGRFVKSCVCGEEVVSGGPFKTRLIAAQAGLKRYKEFHNER